VFRRWVAQYDGPVLLFLSIVTVGLVGIGLYVANYEVQRTTTPPATISEQMGGPPEAPQQAEPQATRTRAPWTRPKPSAAPTAGRNPVPRSSPVTSKPVSRSPLPPIIPTTTVPTEGPVAPEPTATIPEVLPPPPGTVNGADTPSGESE
jgi:hypothetical protein